MFACKMGGGGENLTPDGEGGADMGADHQLSLVVIEEWDAPAVALYSAMGQVSGLDHHHDLPEL